MSGNTPAGAAAGGSLVAAERVAVLGVRAGVLLIIAGFYLSRMFAGIAPEERFFDDFFYYLVAAENWVGGDGSTFFPGEPTNGYHPLWFLWIALLRGATGETGDMFFHLVDASLLALSVGFFLLFERFLRRLTEDRLASVVGAGLAAVAVALFAATGVEMALAACAIAGLLVQVSRKPLAEQTPADAAITGLIGAVVLLSRLDAAILAPGLLFAVWGRWGWKNYAAALAGAAPFYLYLASNLAFFGHLTTTSLAAKSLRGDALPNFYFLQGPAVWFVLASAAVLAFVFLAWRRQPGSDVWRIALALAAAPVLQFMAQAMASGWFLFVWYFYLAILSVGLGVAVLISRLRPSPMMRLAGAGVTALVLGGAVLTADNGLRPGGIQTTIADMGRWLDRFEDEHPGTYAMGDAAGVPGWLMEQPVVHLEGLMMSHEFIDRIRRQQPLAEVFRDYKVDYYVAMRRAPPAGGACETFLEPNPRQASPRARMMQMEVCHPPVSQYASGESRRVLRVYKVDRTTGEVVAP